MSKRMSRQTHLGLICSVTILLLVGVVHADSVDDARGGFNRSMNDFYNAMKTSPDKSAATAKKLSSDIIQPAEQGLLKATTEKGSSGSAGGSLSGGSSFGGTGSTGSPESAPETVLDGSKVPKMIEFPGPVKSPKKPR